MTRTGFFFFITLLLFTIASWWWRTQAEGERQTENTALKQQADFFLKRFHIHQYNEVGKIHYSVHGQYLQHYTNNQRTEIQAPEFKLNRANQPTWHVKAEHAEAKQETLEEVWLNGHVRMTRPAATGYQQLTIQTEKLLLQPNTEYVEAPEHVVINSPNRRITGKSLQANLSIGEFKLQNVKGYYAP